MTQGKRAGILRAAAQKNSFPARSGLRILFLAGGWGEFGPRAPESSSPESPSPHVRIAQEAFYGPVARFGCGGMGLVRPERGIALWCDLWINAGMGNARRRSRTDYANYCTVVSSVGYAQMYSMLSDVRAVGEYETYDPPEVEPYEPFSAGNCGGCGAGLTSGMIRCEYCRRVR